MIVVKRFLDKNTFGGTTWEFMLLNYFKIKIFETNSKSYIFEIHEPNWISYKKVYSFTSELTLNESIEEAFNALYIYFRTRREWNWTEQHKEEDKVEVLSQIKN